MVSKTAVDRGLTLARGRSSRYRLPSGVVGAVEVDPSKVDTSSASTGNGDRKEDISALPIVQLGDRVGDGAGGAKDRMAWPFYVLENPGHARVVRRGRLEC